MSLSLIGFPTVDSGEARRRSSRGRGFRRGRSSAARSPSAPGGSRAGCGLASPGGCGRWLPDLRDSARVRMSENASVTPHACGGSGKGRAVSGLPGGESGVSLEAGDGGGVASASCRQPSALILRRHSRVKPTGYRPFHLLPPAVSGSAFPRVSKMTLLTRTKIRNSTNPMRSRTSPNEAITPPRPKPFRLRGRRARDRARRPAALPRSTWWPLTTGRRSSAFNSFDWIPDAFCRAAA